MLWGGVPQLSFKKVKREQSIKTCSKKESNTPQKREGRKFKIPIPIKPNRPRTSAGKEERAGQKKYMKSANKDGQLSQHKRKSGWGRLGSG